MYNTILRQYPEADFQDLRRGGRLFATTIHVLVSAVDPDDTMHPLWIRHVLIIDPSRIDY